MTSASEIRNEDADAARSLPELFLQQVQRHPQRLAIASGAWQPTNGELDQAATRLACALLSCGGAAGDRVALFMAHDAPLIAAMLAVLKAGRTVVVLNPGDPPARLQQVVMDAEPALIISDAAHDEAAAQLGIREMLRVENHLTGSRVEYPKIFTDIDAVAFLVYTSGSTGHPKGVMQTHRHIIHKAEHLARCFETREGDRVALLASLSGGQGVTVTWCALLGGAALCPFPMMTRGVTGLADWMTAHGITIFVSAASVFRNFARTLDDAVRIRCTRLVWLASEPATSDDVVQCRNLFAEDCVLVHTFSSSETGVMTHLRLAPGDAISEGRLPVGRVFEGVEIFLLDEHGAEVPRGAAGEIAVRSPFLSAGYWRNEAQTAQRFSNPGPDGSRIFRSGDRGRLTADGLLMFLGRADTRVKIHGYRVELSEVEDAIALQPEVERAVVCAQERPGGDARLVAYVVSRPGAVCSENTLRRALRALLPGPMIPAGFVFLEHFPVTPHGKIDRVRLVQMEPLVTSHAAGGSPASETEILIAAIWSGLFDGRAIGRTDDFFHLGGDSLTAAVVAAKVADALQVQLDLRVFADHPTLGEFAVAVDGLLESGGAATTGGLVRVSREEPLPLSFQQERTWKFSQTPEGSAGYTIANHFRICGVLDVGVLRASMTYLAERHEILRTTFEETGGQPVQVIHPAGAVTLTELDFSSAADPEQEARRTFREESLRPFDLVRGPLLRFTLIRLREGESWLQRVNHHIISDGWSWHVYFRELAQIYEALARGEAPSLPRFEPLQYGDYAAWQRASLRSEGEAWKNLIAWWKNIFVDAPSPLHLPFRRPEPRPDAAPSDASLACKIDSATVWRLDQIGREESATHYATRMAAFVALLAAETGREDVILGAYVTDRNSVETQNMFGFFANLVTLRLRFDETLSFRQWLAVVRQTVNQTQARAALPYEQLCEELRRLGVTSPEIRVIVQPNDPKAPLRFGDVELNSLRWRERAIMPWGFTISFSKEDEVHRCDASFDARIYDPAGVRVMLERLVRFLDAASLNPDEPLTGLLQEITGKSLAIKQSADWSDWHRGYDTRPGLAMRLRLVGEQIAAALDESPAGPLTIVSLCAGDGRDIIGALRDHHRRDDVIAWLLDTDEASLARGAVGAAEAGLGSHIKFVQADAGQAASHEGIAPADVVVISGFLGHVRTEDLSGLIASLPMFCKTGGSVIWNKHLVNNDGCESVPAIRELLNAADFVEAKFATTDAAGYAVGRACFHGRTIPLDASRVLFEFRNQARQEPQPAQSGRARCLFG